MSFFTSSFAISLELKPSLSRIPAHSSRVTPELAGMLNVSKTSPILGSFCIKLFCYKGQMLIV